MTQLRYRDDGLDQIVVSRTLQQFWQEKEPIGPSYANSPRGPLGDPGDGLYYVMAAAARAGCSPTLYGFRSGYAIPTSDYTLVCGADSQPTLGVTASGAVGHDSYFVYGSICSALLSLLGAGVSLAIDPQRSDVTISARPKSDSLFDQVRSLECQYDADDCDPQVADRAKDEAAEFLKREDLPGRPLVSLSDEGIVTLQWRKADEGVLLMFFGDGMAEVSVKVPGGHYTTDRAEFAVNDPLPAHARQLIDRLASG